MPDTRCPRCDSPLPEVGPLAGVCPACALRDVAAGPVADDGLETVRALFAELEIQSVLGRGGMGVVYRARQKHLDRPVALKLLVPELAREPTFEERFVREARALAVLDHPNIVRVYDFGEREGTYFLLMELVDGVGLRDVLRAGTLEPAEALVIVPQICAGLQYAHERGVVHRDIKPENILLDREGLVKIADFGLAKLVGDDHATPNLTRTSQVMGTPHYMAPEQAEAPLEVDHRADIYSLGVVFYEMLTGSLPVGRFPAPSQQVRVDVRIDEVVLKTLEREPARRYQHASEVRTDVEDVTRGAGRPSSSTLDSTLGWVGLLPGGAQGVALAALFIAWAWMITMRGVVGTDDHAWVAVAYPFAHLAVRASSHRARAAGPGSASAILLAARGAGFFAGWVSLTLVSGTRDYNWVFVALAAFAVALAHLFFDRWVEGGRPHPLLPAALLAVVATVMHASMWFVPARGLYYYPTGMIALVASASALTRVPAFALGDVPRGATLQLVRAFGVAGVAALLYFHSFLF